MALGTIIISLSLLMAQVGTPPREEQLTESKRADIERLLQLTTAPLLKQSVSNVVMKDLTESLKVAVPDLPDTAQKSAIAEAQLVIGEFANEFLKELYPSYNRLFTQAEINEMLAFYDTALGRKMLGAASLLESEGRAAAEKNVRTLYSRVTQRVIERLQKEGFMKR